MINHKIVEILVSCPSDVTIEKEQIIRLCKDFSDANRGNSNITLNVLDWKNYVGEQGTRPQQQLKEYFGIYDVYIGILWKRFGTNPGSVNFTGCENESGTQEEFCDAIEYKSKNKRLQINFFIKTNDRNTNNLEENEQLGKVFKFINDQKNSNNNFLNFFDSPDLFNSEIVKLLKKIENNVFHESQQEAKDGFLSYETKIKIAFFRKEEIYPTNYQIVRSTLHFKLIKDKLTNTLLEKEQQALDQLILLTKRVVLLGDAGSGKSTELKGLNYRLSQDTSSFIPILQNFNSYTPEIGLEEFLPAFWQEVPENLLVIIWDGLDEIEPKSFNTVVRQINNFSEKYKEIRILISCRTNFYELPVNSPISTLTRFEPYLIKDLNLKDINEYYSIKYSSDQSSNFIKEIYKNNLGDLVTKPFFLMLLAERYFQDKKLLLKRAELFELFLDSRFNHDKIHFNNTIELRSKRQEILILLQKVALCMEILSKNQIKESDILCLISSIEFNLLKYCTAFKKRDGAEDIWQFEHNNIQEFLAAKALSNLEFNKVIKFITFAPNHNKLLPNWVNTFSFLFSILDPKSSLFKNLLQWILENEKEVIIKFEPDKIPESLRAQIFQGIFNYYKNHDIWISSNKFIDRELAKFGQSVSNLLFLIQEIKKKENTKIVHINAIRLIGHFQIEGDDLKSEIERILLQLIERNVSDSNFIHTTIYSLNWSDIANPNTIEKLMEQVGSRKNQYIRAAMYAILLESKVLEDYVYYLIEGFELIDKKIIGEREDTSLIDEGLNLKECIKNIKTSKGIKEIVDYISESTTFEYVYDSENVIEVLLANARKVYENDTSIFNPILRWFKKDVRGFLFEKTSLLLQFFDETNTREKAFLELWLSNEDGMEENKSFAIAKLLTPDLMPFVIDEYLKLNLTKKELQGIYFDMCWVDNINQVQLEKLILEKTDFKINKPEQIDYESLKKERLKFDFNLLFNQQTFKEATLCLFEKEQKDALSFDALVEIQRKSYKLGDKEAIYPNVIITLLRGFVSKGQLISKEEIIMWFDEDANVEQYRVSIIYEYLINYKELMVSSEQEQWIFKWCNLNVPLVNFKKAIEVYDDGRFTFERKAMYIWYFSKRFNIDHSKSVLLDMLSFDFIDGNNLLGIEYLISKLHPKEIEQRMFENIKESIANSLILKNHVKFLAKHKVKESYPFIMNEIINFKRNVYERHELLNIFFEYTKDTNSIKTIINQADGLVKWAILDMLKANDQEIFVEEYLLKILEKSTDNEEISKASEILVSLQNIQGLKVYVAWIKNNFEDYINTRSIMCLENLKTNEAIPYLIELLELSYKMEIKKERFDSLNYQILGSFYNIGLVSEENLKKVKLSLHEFIKENSSVCVKVKYIFYTIERMEKQFFTNNAQSFTLHQVKEKLKLLEQ